MEIQEINKIKERLTVQRAQLLQKMALFVLENNPDLAHKITSTNRALKVCEKCETTLVEQEQFSQELINLLTVIFGDWETFAYCEVTSQKSILVN